MREDIFTSGTSSVFAVTISPFLFPPLRMMAYRYSLLVLWLQLDRALLLSSNDPNVCSYWER